MKPRVFNPSQGRQQGIARSRSRSNRKSPLGQIPPVSPPNPRQILLHLVDYIDSRLGNKVNAITGLINKNKRELRQAQASFAKVEREVFEIKSKTVQKSPICDDIRNFFKAMKNQVQDSSELLSFQETSNDLRDSLKPNKSQRKISVQNKENSPFVMAKKVGRERSRTPVSKVKSNAFPGMRPPSFNPKVPKEINPSLSKSTTITPQKPCNKSHQRPLKEQNLNQNGACQNKVIAKMTKKATSAFINKTPSPLKVPERSSSPGQRLQPEREKPALLEKRELLLPKVTNDYDSRKVMYKNNHLDFLEKAITEVDDEDSEQQRISCVEPQENVVPPAEEDKDESMIKDLMSFYEDAPKQPRKSKFVRLRDQNKFASLKRHEESSSKDIKTEYPSGVDEEDLKFFVGSFTIQAGDNTADEKKPNRVPKECRTKILFSSQEETSNQHSTQSMQRSSESQASSVSNRRLSRDDDDDDDEQEDEQNRGINPDAREGDIFDSTRLMLKHRLADEGRQIDSMIRETERLIREKERIQRLEERSYSPNKSLSDDKINSERKLMKEIELEKLEVAKMLENMMMSNTSVRDNHAAIESIFKKYQLTESEKKMTSLVKGEPQQGVKTFEEGQSASSRKHVIMVDENFLSFNNQHMASSSDLSNCKLTLVEEDKKEQTSSNIEPTRDQSAEIDCNALPNISNNLVHQWNMISVDVSRKPFAVLTQKNSRDKDQEQQSYASKQSSNCFYSSGSKDEMRQKRFQLRSSIECESDLKFSGFNSSSQE